jgi:hypothetical protein
MATAEQQEILDAIASAGQDLAVLRPESAQVLRSVSEPDGYGGQTSTESVVAAVGCRRKMLSGRDLASAAKLAPSASWKVVLDPGTDVTVSDALLVDGTRYEVVWVGGGTFAAELPCFCEVAG